MYTPNLVSILFCDQPLSIFKFDDVMPTSRIKVVKSLHIKLVRRNVFTCQFQMYARLSPGASAAELLRTLSSEKHTNILLFYYNFCHICCSL